MDVLTQHPGSPTWTRWPSVLRGILVAVGDPSRCVVLFSARPQEERVELADAVRLIRRAAGPGIPIVVASPPADGSWRDELRLAGTDQIWTVERRDDGTSGRIMLERVRDTPSHSTSRPPETSDAGRRAWPVRGRAEAPEDPGAEQSAVVAPRRPGTDRSDAEAEAGGRDGPLWPVSAVRG